MLRRYTSSPFVSSISGPPIVSIELAGEREHDCRARLPLPGGGRSYATDTYCRDRPWLAETSAVQPEDCSLVSARSHHQTMDRLHVPVAIHELDREPVQQFRMRRRFSALAEVEYGGDQRLAEVAQPDVIDRDPRRQRIVLRGDPAGEREPPAGTGSRVLRARWACSPRPAPSAP